MVAAMARFIDPEAAAGEVLRLGTIASIDLANGTCTVESGDIIRPARPAGERYGIRSDQLALFLIAVIDARLEALEVA
jgi:hypothetical protein